MSRNNIKFTTDGKIYCNELIVGGTPASEKLPFDADYNVCCEDISEIDTTQIKYKSDKTIECAELIEGNPEDYAENATTIESYLAGFTPEVTWDDETGFTMTNYTQLKNDLEEKFGYTGVIYPLCVIKHNRKRRTAKDANQSFNAFRVTAYSAGSVDTNPWRTGWDFEDDGSIPASVGAKTYSLSNANAKHVSISYSYDSMSTTSQTVTRKKLKYAFIGLKVGILREEGMRGSCAKEYYLSRRSRQSLGINSDGWHGLSSTWYYGFKNSAYPKGHTVTIKHNINKPLGPNPSTLYAGGYAIGLLPQIFINGKNIVSFSPDKSLGYNKSVNINRQNSITITYNGGNYGSSFAIYLSCPELGISNLALTNSTNITYDLSSDITITLS